MVYECHDCGADIALGFGHRSGCKYWVGWVGSDEVKPKKVELTEQSVTERDVEVLGYEQLRQRIERLEAEVFKPCIYEARPYTAAPTVLTGGDSVFGVWCQTHGWDCPGERSADGRR